MFCRWFGAILIQNEKGSGCNGGIEGSQREEPKVFYRLSAHLCSLLSVRRRGGGRASLGSRECRRYSLCVLPCVAWDSCRTVFDFCVLLTTNLRGGQSAVLRSANPTLLCCVFRVAVAMPCGRPLALQFPALQLPLDAMTIDHHYNCYSHSCCYWILSLG